METIIVIIPVDAMSNGRKKLEDVENKTFERKTDILNAICFDKDDPCDSDSVLMVSLSDFMDWCNDDELNFDNNWVGYVKLDKQ